MLKKSNRLNLKKDFRFVASGKRLETQFFKVFYRDCHNDFPLVGISLSRGEFKKAYDRNRARRLISSALESIYKKLSPTLSLIILPKNAILDHSSDEVKLVLENVKDIYKNN